MNMIQRCASGVIIVLAAPAMSLDIVLHDNGMVPDGVTGSPIGSPMVPDVRAAEDFVVPEGDVWTVTGLRYVLSPAVGMDEGPLIEVQVCTDSDGDGPLSPVFSATIPFTREYIGDYFGGPAYEYTVSDLELVLGPGVYWTSPVFPEASDEGYMTWLTARMHDVRRQRDLGWFSPDAMATWFRMDDLGWEGDYWHHAFQVLGQREGPPLPEPAEGDRQPNATARDRIDGLESQGPTPSDAPQRQEREEQPAAPGELLWNNELVPDGTMARAISPPGFPDIRVADDFVVPEEGWIIRGAHLNGIEDMGWTHGGEITVFILSDEGSGPSEFIHEVTVPLVRMATGDQYFGRDGYDYWAEDLEIELDQGDYWIAFRNGGGGGAGTNYWQISDGGPDGIDSSTGWFSLDGGKTWVPEGDAWHHAFEIRGVVGMVSIALPHSFEVTRGVRVAGGLISLTTSDDDYLIIEARRPTAVSQPSVQVIVEGDAGNDSLARFEFTLEASATFGRIVQWIDFYDFDADGWERMDTRDATINDSIVVVSVDDGADRFRDDETGAIRARISFWDPGIPVAGWFGRIDQTVWRVVYR